MSFSITNPAKVLDAKRAAIEAAKNASASKALGNGSENKAALIRFIPAAECPDRNRIVFDDSGSMSGQIENAKQGVVEYLRNCIPNQTAAAIHFMCTKSWSTALRSDLPQLSADLQEAQLHLDNTPFFNTCKAALEATPVLTRLIAFTDGSPTDELQAEEHETSAMQGFYSRGADSWKASADVIIKIAHNIGDQSLSGGYVSKTSGAHGPCIPIDTVFFGVDSEWSVRERELLKYLSDATGGYFMVFDPAKVNFRTAFKYLAPVNRLMLASSSFRAELESGKKS